MDHITTLCVNCIKAPSPDLTPLRAAITHQWMIDIDKPVQLDRNFKPMPVLLYACVRGNDTVALELLQLHANPNTVTVTIEKPPVHPTTNMPICSACTATPLYYAVRYGKGESGGIKQGHKKCIQHLLQYGAKPCVDAEQRSLFHQVARYRIDAKEDFEFMGNFMKALAAMGATLSKDIYSQTPAQLAASVQNQNQKYIQLVNYITTNVSKYLKPDAPSTSDKIRAYKSRWHRYFAIRMDNVRFDEHSIFTATFADIAAFRNNHILRTLHGVEDGEAIVDGTASIGSDTISFLACFPGSKVLSNELDPTRMRYLLSNSLLGLEQLRGWKGIHRVRLGGVRELFQDQLFHDTRLLYLDPDWGGASYTANETTELHISKEGDANTRIEFAVLEAFKAAPELQRVVLKLPYNYDRTHLEALADYRVSTHRIFTANQDIELPSSWKEKMVFAVAERSEDQPLHCVHYLFNGVKIAPGFSEPPRTDSVSKKHRPPGPVYKEAVSNMADDEFWHSVDRIERIIEHLHEERGVQTDGFIDDVTSAFKGAVKGATRFAGMGEKPPGDYAFNGTTYGAILSDIAKLEAEAAKIKADLDTKYSEIKTAKQNKESCEKQYHTELDQKAEKEKTDANLKKAQEAAAAAAAAAAAGRK